MSRRFGAVPTIAVTIYCLAAAALSLVAHLMIEVTAWPSSALGWGSVIALGAGPVRLEGPGPVAACQSPCPGRAAAGFPRALHRRRCALCDGPLCRLPPRRFCQPPAGRPHPEDRFQIGLIQFPLGTPEHDHQNIPKQEQEI